jgi:hypothetical protein
LRVFAGTTFFDKLSRLPKVGEHYSRAFAPRCQKDILGFDVTVHDPTGVKILQGLE